MIRRTDDKLYIAELLLLFGICVCTVTRNGDTASTFFKTTFIVLLVAVLLQIYQKQVINELHLMASATILIAFAHIIIRTDVYTFSYFKKFIIFSSTVLMIPFVDGISVTRKMVRWILRINLAIALIYPIAYWGFGIRGWLGGRYLTLYFSNPNLTAMYLMHSILYCAISFYYFRHWLTKLFSILLTAALLWLDYQTGARSTFVALAVFAILSFANIVLKKDIRISSSISALLLWSPLIIAVTYLMIYNSGILERWFSFLIEEGKPMSSRVGVWTDALEAYKGHLLLGAYHDISEGTGMSQMHNIHLDILTSYGPVPFVLFVLLLIRCVNKVLPSADTNLTRMALYAFYAVIIQSAFEAALVSGGVGLYVMSFGFLLLARCNEMQLSDA